MDDHYPLPTFIRITSATPEGDQLYELESRRNDLIEECAKLQGQILEFEKSEFWTKALPHQILSILDSYDTKASYAACKAFINWHDAKTKQVALR